MGQLMACMATLRSLQPSANKFDRFEQSLPRRCSFACCASPCRPLRAFVPEVLQRYYYQLANLTRPLATPDSFIRPATA